MASSLGKLQSFLERIYEIKSGCDVERFLITDSDLVREIDNGAGAREIPEKLLVRSDRDGVDIALYVDAGVIEVLRDNDPVQSLNDDNLSQFWTALEGVSHFLYLIWNARHGRGVSRFELELQAEVDKFAVAAALLALQNGLRIPRELHQRLFFAPEFDTRLRGEELKRYQRANHYAGLYCGRLQQECLEDRRSSMVRELRRFYRLTHRHKLQHITRDVPGMTAG